MMIETEKQLIRELNELKLQILPLTQLGLIDPTGVRATHVGASNYSSRIIQPWSIWLDWNLNPWDADMIKRIGRTKTEPGISAIDARIQDYQKIIHISNERIRQLKGTP